MRIKISRIKWQLVFITTGSKKNQYDKPGELGRFKRKYAPGFRQDQSYFDPKAHFGFENRPGNQKKSNES